MKKAIFLFLYILLFLSIPASVGYFSSGDKKVELRVEEKIIYPGPPVQEMGPRLVQIEEQTSKEERVATTLFICFFISVWIAFIVAILKSYNPTGISTIFSLGIWIFNIVYVPLYVLTNFGNVGRYFGYYIFALIASMLILVVLFHFILMIVSLVLIIVGIGKEKTLSRIIPPATPQTPQSSPHPQS